LDIPFELHIALRYLLARRKQAFISVISLISTLGVMIGVMAVVIALAIMTGLQQELRDRILGSNAHVYVVKAGGLTDYHAEVTKMMGLPHVLGAAPAILGQGLITGRSSAPIQIKGIDPVLEARVTEVARAVKKGSLNGLTPPDGADAGAPDGILLGKDLAASIGVGVGDSVSVLSPQGTLTPFAGMLPGRRRFRVVGLFSLGFYEFDASYGFVSLDAAGQLFRKKTPDYIQLRVDDIYDAPRIAKAIPTQLGAEYLANDWSAMNGSLFSALRLEKIAVSLAVGLIVMVAALNIVASLILLVMEKNRDIAILKTMGASARSITIIFMMQGLIIGLAGTTAGASAGWLLSYVFDRYQLIRVSVDVYQISHLPFTVLPRDFAIVIGCAVLICFVATLYPSRQAARLDPATALRY
jgi:lipoprotein-releasing system permease protein